MRFSLSLARWLLSWIDMEPRSPLSARPTIKWSAGFRLAKLISAPGSPGL